MIGGGANLLVGDDTLDAVVVRLEDQSMLLEGNSLTVAAGCPIIKTVIYAAQQGLSGIEWGTSVPGTWGGALAMNAGAYGGQTGDTVEWAEVLTRAGEIQRIPGSMVEWHYRHSVWPVEVLCFLKLRINLTPGDKTLIRQRQSEIAAERKRKFPKAPCAGSTFKNPPGESSGRLIENCGLKGHHIGGAMVSKEHANIFINRGTKSLDMIQLILHCRRMVQEKTGILLEPEVVLWDRYSYDEWEKELF